MTTDTTNQAAWIAYDNAFAAAGGGKVGVKAGMRARASILMGPNVEGPAEHPASFSARSTVRLFAVQS